MSPSDDSTYQRRGSKNAMYILLGIKIFELIFICLCFGFIDDPAVHANAHGNSFITQRVIALCYVTFGFLIIYTSVYIIMTVFGDIIPWRSATLWCLIALILYIACTAMLFRDWSNIKQRPSFAPNMQRLDYVLTTACISLIACLFFIADLVVTISYGVKGELE